MSPQFFLGLLIFCVTATSFANANTGLCDLSWSKNIYAESRCFEIARPLNSPFENESSFKISSVMMTKSLDTASDKDNLVLVAGGPGTDAQALQYSLNQGGFLNAFWNHMNLNVFLYDSRGIVHSPFQKMAEHYPQSEFTTELNVEDLKAVIETVSPDKPVILMAHSAGGNIAARLAAMYPTLVKGLILYSASIDTMEIGDSNRRLYAKDFEHFDQYLAARCSESSAVNLKGQQVRIESFLRDVVKLIQLKNIRPKQLSGFYMRFFREEMVVAIENDHGCNGLVPGVLNQWFQKISKLPTEVVNQVNEANPLRFSPSNYEPVVTTRGDWVKKTIICSEGFTVNQLKEELWLEGLQFDQDSCSGISSIYEEAPDRKWLSEIQAPTLLLGGTHDIYQVPSAVQRNASMIPNSKVVLFDGGGHEAHIDTNNAMLFYNSIKEFVAP